MTTDTDKPTSAREAPGWAPLACAPMYVYGRDALVGAWDGIGWRRVSIWEPEWTRDDIIHRGGTHWWPHLRDLPAPKGKGERAEAALHACEGLDTADLKGNDRGWVAGVIHDAARVDSELNYALRACCAGNTDDDEPVRCQSYEASEQSEPCPRGRCVMAEPQGEAGVPGLSERTAACVAEMERVVGMHRGWINVAPIVRKHIEAAMFAAAPPAPEEKP